MLVCQAILTALCALASFGGIHGREQGEVVDLVFMVREAPEMQEDHDQIRRQASNIFETLRKETGDSFRVGLVGFGSRINNGLPRRLGPLTEDLSAFEEALDRLTSEESAQTAPAFRTIIRSTRSLDGKYMDGSYEGNTFPGANGYCAIMLTNTPSSGDGKKFSSIAAVTKALNATSREPKKPSPLYAIVPPSELNQENSFATISQQTGGAVYSIPDFRKTDDSAASILTQTCTNCARYMMSSAGCETNGPFNQVTSTLPAEFELNGRPACRSGETFLMAFWTSPNAEVDLTQPTGSARAVIRSHGRYTVCQTVTCIDSGSGKTNSNTCCTELAVVPPGGLPTRPTPSSGAYPSNPRPSPYDPLPGHGYQNNQGFSSSSDSSDLFPIFEEKNVVCDPNGPYRFGAIDLPASFTLDGEASCIGDCKVLKAFWTTYSDAIFFKSHYDPAYAIASKYGKFAVCLTVDAINNESGRITSNECCTTVRIARFDDENILCETNGPYTATAHYRENLPAEVSLNGRLQCPFGYIVRDSEWRSKSKEIWFDEPLKGEFDFDVVGRAVARVKDYGSYIVCQAVTCEKILSDEIMYKECCTTLDVGDGRGEDLYDSHEPHPYPDGPDKNPKPGLDKPGLDKPGLGNPGPDKPGPDKNPKPGPDKNPKPDPDPYPGPHPPAEISCDTNGPYSESASSLPATVELRGTVDCPPGYNLYDAVWSNPSGDMQFTSPANPATALVSSFGEIIVCQTVICWNQGRKEQESKECCTTLWLEESHAPKEPTGYNPAPTPNIQPFPKPNPAPYRPPSGGPGSPIEGIVCDTKGPYFNRSKTLPVFVDLFGHSKCPSEYKLYDSFWSSKSSEVMIPADGNARATVSGFGVFEICQTVTCFDQVTTMTKSIQCCTTLELEEILPPSPPTAVPTPAPTLGLCETNGPYEARTTTLPGYVHLDGDNNCPAGTSLVSAIWSSDDPDVLLPISNDPATVRISSYGTFVACQTVTCKEDRGITTTSTDCCTSIQLLRASDLDGPTRAPTSNDGGCNTRGPYTEKAYDLPAFVDLNGSAGCPAGHKTYNVFWSSPSSEVTVSDGSSSATARVTGFGKYDLCQTVTCLDPATRVTSSSQCCTTIQVDKLGNKPKPDICDTYGPYRDSTKSLPGFVNLVGSATCPPGEKVIKARWASPAPQVEISNSKAKISDYGKYIVCRSVTCGDLYSGTKSTKECCTTVQLVKKKNKPDICDTFGPYEDSTIALPGFVSLYGSATCPPGANVFDAYWSSPSSQVQIAGSTAKVFKYGKYIVCQTVTCGDQGSGRRTTKECCTTVKLNKANIPISCNTGGPIASSASSLPAYVNLYGDPYCPPGFYVSEAHWSSPSRDVQIVGSKAQIYDFGVFIACQTVICSDRASGISAAKDCCTTIQFDNKKEATPILCDNKAISEYTRTSDLPGKVELHGDAICPEGFSISDTFWSSPSSDVVISGYKAKLYDFGLFIVCQTVTCSDEYSSRLTSKECCTTIQHEEHKEHKYEEPSIMPSSPSEPPNPAPYGVPHSPPYEPPHSAPYGVPHSAPYGLDPSSLIACTTDGPFYASASASTLPAVGELVGSYHCPPGYVILEERWSSSASPVSFPNNDDTTNVTISAFGTFEVCLLITCVEPTTEKIESIQCCSEIIVDEVDDGPLPPSDTPSKEHVAIGCNANGPYSVYESNLPSTVQLEGTGVCPFGYRIDSVDWSSPTSELSILQPGNPTLAEVFSYGSLEVCQTVTCLDPSNDKKHSAQCCTSLEVSAGNKNHYPAPKPDHYPAPTAHHYPAPTAHHYPAPAATPGYSLCETNGPYLANDTSLPGFVDLHGHPSCHPGDLVVQALWSSPSSDVTFPVAAAPERAQVYAFDTFVVCLTVTCLDEPTTDTYSKECCTTLQLDQVYDEPNEGPKGSHSHETCQTNGPYSSDAPHLPGVVEVEGTPKCPYGYDLLEALWSSPTTEIKFQQRENPATVEVYTFGSSTICQTVICIDSTTGDTSSKQCCTTIELSENHYGPGGGPAYSPALLPTRPSYNVPEPKCDTKGPYTVDAAYLPSEGVLSGSFECPYGYEFREEIWSSPSPDIQFSSTLGKPTRVEVYTYGSSTICQTVICSHKSSRENISKQCCTTIELKKSQYGLGHPAGNQEPRCDTNGPYSVDAHSLPGVVQVFGSHKCGYGQALVEVWWSSPSNHVNFPTRSNPTLVYVDSYGSSIMCQTVVCADPLTGQKTSTECCTQIEVNEQYDRLPQSNGEPICDTNGPYKYYDGDYSRKVELYGTASCPNGFVYLESKWSSVASEVYFESYGNPAWVRASDYGNYIVCQTVFCVNVLTHERRSTKCCTTLESVEGRSGSFDSGYGDDRFDRFSSNYGYGGSSSGYYDEDYSSSGSRKGGGSSGYYHDNDDFKGGYGGGYGGIGDDFNGGFNGGYGNPYRYSGYSSGKGGGKGDKGYRSGSYYGSRKGSGSSEYYSNDDYRDSGVSSGYYYDDDRFSGSDGSSGY